MKNNALFSLFNFVLFLLVMSCALPALAQNVEPPITIGTTQTIPSAGNLTLSAIGGETGSYSSNPLLSIGKTQSLIGSTTSPELILKDTTPTQQLNLDTRVDENVFNHSDFNSTDIHAAGDISQQNQRWAVTLPQHIDYDTTRTSELSNYNFGINSTRHFGYNTAPQITFAPTAVDSLALGGAVTTSQYDNHIFTDYNTYAVTPSYQHHVDALNTAIVSLQAQRYETTDNTAAHVDSIGPSVGWRVDFTPRLSANAAVGAQTSRTYQENTAASPWQWQAIFATGLTFTGEQDVVRANITRAETPYGNGTEALQTNFAVNESHALNPLLSLDFGANYLTSSYQTYVAGSQDSYFGGTVGLSYHATEHIDFKTSYTYRDETLSGGLGSPHDNQIMLNAVFHPKLWTLSE